MTAYHVYSNQGYGPILYTHPIATEYGTSFQSSALSAPSTWQFAVRAFDDTTGLEERNIDQSVAVIIGPTGLDITGQPSAPIGLAAFAGSAGSIRVHWSYPASQATPTGFNVYAGTTGSPDYSAPLATVANTDGSMRPSYSATLAGLADATTYTIGVRSYNASGEESNTTTVSTIARTTGPTAVVGLSITAIQ